MRISRSVSVTSWVFPLCVTNNASSSAEWLCSLSLTGAMLNKLLSSQFAVPWRNMIPHLADL